MGERDSRAEYQRRMHKVVEYIDRHLDESLDLDTLAGIANFSSFHFHRLFSAWMGETLGDYLRRRRLETAAQRLAAQPRMPVLAVALSVGFGSGEAFTRAFRQRFGSAPSAWRQEQARRRAAKKSNPGQLISKPGQASTGNLRDTVASPQAHRESAMNITLIDRQPVTIAYMRHTGPYGEPVSRFWHEVFFPWMQLHGLQGRPFYGMGQDDPSITAPEQCRYDAGVEVPEGFQPGANAYLTTIPGGRYASLAFKGSVADVGAAWDVLLRDWLPASGLRFDARPCFEYYGPDASFDPATGVFTCDICIPVVPL